MKPNALGCVLAVGHTDQARHRQMALGFIGTLIPLLLVLRFQGATIGQLALVGGFAGLGALILAAERAKNPFTLTFATAVVPAGVCVLAAEFAGPLRDVFVPLIMASVGLAPQQRRWRSVAAGWLACTAAWWWLLGSKGTSGLIEASMLSLTYAVLAGLLYDKCTRMRRLQHDLMTETEAAHAAARAKSQFLMAMSHEVRTPLNGVIGMTELALRGPLTMEQRDAFTTIRSSADWLAMTFTEVLECAKAESGRITFHDTPWDVRSSMEDLARVLAPAAHQKGLELVLDIDAAVPLSARGDAFRIRQVVTRLAGSGIKYTEEGFVRIHLSTPAQDRLAFVVEDTGIGVAEKDHERLFDGFPQVDASTSPRVDGTGLGLALARELATRMGGTLEVRSSLDRGCAFRFEVPARTETPARESSLLAGASCAVLSDVPVSRSSIGRLLTSLGATLCDDGRASLVVLDVPVRYSEGWLASLKPIDGGVVALVPPGARTTRELERLGVSAVVFKPAFLSLGKALAHVLVAQTQALARVRPRLGDSVGPEGSLVVLPFGTKPLPAPCRFTALVAEDSPVNAKMLVRLLEQLGAECEVVGNGALAVQRAREARFDIIFMDINMPEMDGLEAARRIREDGRGEHIVAVTARSSSDDEGACMRAGMNSFLPKPVNARHLGQLVKQVVEQLLPTLGVATR